MVLKILAELLFFVSGGSDVTSDKININHDKQLFL
jgi:hypothetical protein